MRIGVDAHVLAGKFQGSRTYLYNLYKEVLKQTDPQGFVFFGHWDKDAPYGKDKTYIDFPSHSKLKRLTFQTATLLKKYDIDLYHTQYISPLSLPCQSLVTIHDILFESHPQFFTKSEVIRNKILVRNSAKKAVQIQTVSSFSKASIAERYHIDPDRIVVVPNGVDGSRYNPGNKDEAVKQVAAEFGIRDYILTVGRIEPRKNHMTLLRAYKLLKERHKDIGPLVIVGNPDFGFRDFFEYLEKEKIKESVKIVSGVSDQMLPLIYKAAKVFAYPSYAEGFGIPPLEAMASGVPVIVSNTTAIPEVVGESGILVNPLNAEEIAHHIETIYFNPELQNYLAAAGITQAGQWTWENAAKQYISTIGRLCS
ncbi:glycosyltransferase family 4 protein [Gorillibacterium sp. sgz5001074]|uniref:glycosyltransferase family 4 protein n=1 Tax=Gorillibacterium sp. sgz5001074 TaxID=3446695 RepID=UPI003F66431C